MMDFDQNFANAVVDGAPELPTNVTKTITLVLSTGRGAEQKFSWTLDGGRLMVVDAVSSDDALVLTVAPRDAEAILAGELSIPVAYMQGRLKPAGDNGLWLRLVKAATGEANAFDAWRAAVLQSTATV
jgi:hypothetical protein